MSDFTGKAIVDELARRIVRAFHSAPQVVAYDAIIREGCAREDQVAARLLLSAAHLRRLLKPLEEDCLIECDQLKETKEDGTGKRDVWYWYIDYRRLVDVIKWRVLKITEMALAMERAPMDRVQYKCEYCERIYDMTGLSRLQPTPDGSVCEDCGKFVHEVEEEVTGENASLLSRINNELKPIILLLKNTEDIEIARVIKPIEAQELEQRRLENGGMDGDEDGGAGGHGSGNRAGLGQSGFGGKGAQLDYMGNQDRKVVIDLDGNVKPVVQEDTRAIWMKSSIELEEQAAAAAAAQADTKSMTAASGPATLGAAAGAAAGTAGQGEGENGESREDIAKAYEERMLAQMQAAAAGAGTTTTANTTGDETGPEADDATMTSTDGELDDYHVAVQGQVYHWDDVTDELIAQMTVVERERYDRLNAMEEEGEEFYDDDDDL